MKVWEERERVVDKRSSYDKTSEWLCIKKNKGHCVSAPVDRTLQIRKEDSFSMRQER